MIKTTTGILQRVGGDGVRVGVVETSGTLVAEHDLRRPAVTTCSLGSLVPSGSATVTVAAWLLRSPDEVTNTACVETSNCATTVTKLP